MERKFMRRFQSFKNSLEAQNRLIHDYDGKIVKAYCQRIVNVYIEKFREFQLQVEGIGVESN